MTHQSLLSDAQQEPVRSRRMQTQWSRELVDVITTLRDRGLSWGEILFWMEQRGFKTWKTESSLIMGYRFAKTRFEGAAPSAPAPAVPSAESILADHDRINS